MPQEFPKLRLPRIERIALRRFSLYSANPNAEITCDQGVLCLVGANGIGKSTLLSAINFCLTGIVPDPERTFASIDEFYRFTKQYSSMYFRGRIDGTDQDDAEVHLAFSLGDRRYEIHRGLFEPEELRHLLITYADGEIAVNGEADSSRRELHLRYASEFVKDCGVVSFEEFAFLQHFVFTFDEQRKTLFWNLRIMERVLYRAFGLEPDMAKRADSTRREIQHEDSKVRNYQWEATRMRKRINEIRSQLQAQAGAQQTFETLTSSHEDLTAKFEEDTATLRKLEDAVKDAHLALSDKTVRETALREEYSRLFSEALSSRPPLASSPIITESIARCVCGICGASEPHIAEKISQKSESTLCPLCDSPLDLASDRALNTDRLQSIDKELAVVRRAVKDIQRELEKLREAERSARAQWTATKQPSMNLTKRTPQPLRVCVRY